VACDSATFGRDPIENTPKFCQFSDELYASCAAEGGTCTFDGTKEVRFGANGQWVSKMATGSAPCSADTFGRDPLPNVAKTCEYR
jgi:serine protease